MSSSLAPNVVYDDNVNVEEWIGAIVYEKDRARGGEREVRSLIVCTQKIKAKIIMTSS